MTTPNMAIMQGHIKDLQSQQKFWDEQHRLNRYRYHAIRDGYEPDFFIKLLIGTLIFGSELTPFIVSAAMTDDLLSLPVIGIISAILACILHECENQCKNCQMCLVVVFIIIYFCMLCGTISRGFQKNVIIVAVIGIIFLIVNLTLLLIFLCRKVYNYNCNDRDHDAYANSEIDSFA